MDAITRFPHLRQSLVLATLTLGFAACETDPPLTPPVLTGAADLTPPGFVEHDTYGNWWADITILDEGSPIPVALTGSASMDVFFEVAEGSAVDDDGNGREEVATVFTGMDLTGTSPLGPIRLRVVTGSGQIEENANNTAGVLDVQPFTATGSATTTLDVMFEVTIGSEVFLADLPQALTGTFTHKPAQLGDELLALAPVPLERSDGSPTQFQLGASRHLPAGRFVEHDNHPNWAADFVISKGRRSYTVPLSGPVSMDVFFEYREGEATDDNGNARDEVATIVTAMDLTGPSLWGPVTVRASGSQGTLEENANNTPGILDVPPFTAGGTLNARFDILFEVTINGEVLVAAAPRRVAGTFRHKPAAPQDVLHQNRQVRLLDQEGNPSDYRIRSSRHWPNGRFVEHDIFESWAADMRIIKDGVGSVAPLVGPVAMDVFFERREGEALDDDADGLEDVSAVVTSMDLRGPSLWGPVRVRTLGATGSFEEDGNNTPGVLDVQPFTAAGTLTADLTVLYEVTINGQVLYATAPRPLRGTLNHKPAALGDFLTTSQGVPLVDARGNPTPYRIGKAKHWPRGRFVEHDNFANWTANFTFVKDGEVQRVAAVGPVSMDVFFEYREGEAVDDDGNGREEVGAFVTAMNLNGRSAWGPIGVRVVTSDGVFTERANNTPGILDVPPFTSDGRLNARLRLLLEVTINGEVFYAAEPHTVRGRLRHKPAAPQDTLQSDDAVQLFTADGQPTAYWLDDSHHVPSAPAGP